MVQSKFILAYLDPDLLTQLARQVLEFALRLEQTEPEGFFLQSPIDISVALNVASTQVACDCRSNCT